MHKFLVRVSQLTFSFFSARERVSAGEHCPPVQPKSEVPVAPHLATARHATGTVPAAHLPATHLRRAAPGGPRSHTVRPVRVLRTREGAIERLAIVGRMADVCAELDRLAARERPC